MELPVDQIFQEAIAAHNSGDLEEAKRLYSSILKVEPTHPRVIHNLGLIDLSAGKVVSALQLFEEAIEENSSIEQFWISYIDTLISEKQFENAKQAIIKGKKKGVDKKILNALQQKFMSVKEGNIPIKSPPESEIQKLINHYENGQYEDAETLATSLTEQFPEHHFSWKVLGAVLKQTGRVSESLIASQKSINLNPQDAEGHNNIGVSLQEMGRLEDAEVSYRRAIALKPEFVDPHYNLSVTLQELGRIGDAEASYIKAIALKPDYAEAHSNLGNTLKERGRFEDAEASYIKAISLKPNYADVHNNLGNVLKEISRFEDAEVSYRLAIKLRPDYSEAHSNLGITLKEMNRLEEAEESLRQAITLKSNLAEAHTNLGKLLLKIGKHHEGLNEEKIGAGFISFNLNKGVSLI